MRYYQNLSQLVLGQALRVVSRWVLLTVYACMQDRASDMLIEAGSRQDAVVMGVLKGINM